MKALFLIADGFEDSEFLVPYYRLLEEGMEVLVAGPHEGPTTGKHGYSFQVTKAFHDVDPGAFDLLILPGGRGAELVRMNVSAVEIARSMMNSGKPIASICHGIQTLISADLVRGRKVTCWPGIRDDVKAAGAEYHDEELVVDNNLITSRYPDDLPAFCRAILEGIAATTEAT